MEYNKKRRLAEIAYMYYIDGLNQSQIAKEYSISRSMVSTMLSEAKELGIVNVQIEDSELYCFDLQNKMKKIFDIEKAIIVPKLSKTEENLRYQLADACINYLNHIIKDDTTIAVSWGRTLYAIANRIRTTGKDNIKICPLVGGVGNEMTMYHSNMICDIMAKNLGGKSYGLYAPVFVSTKEVKEVIFQDKSINNVMEISKNADLAIMSVGNIFSSVMIEAKSLEDSEVDELLKLGAIGDINASLFNKDGKIIKTDLIERTISVSMKSLKRIPKIIVIAGGKNKLEAIHAALKGKLMDVLITDEEVARNILNQYK